MPRRKGSPEPLDPASAPPGTPAFVVARDSGGDRQTRSVGEQVAVMEGICAEHQWVIVDRFLDRKRKGGDLSREEFNRLLARLQERPVAAKILLYWDEKRIARDRGQGMLVEAYCLLAGVAFYSASMPIPLAAQKYVTPMMFTMGEEESIQQGRDIARGLATMIEKGYAPGGLPPRGYIRKYDVVGQHRNGQDILWPKWVPDLELEEKCRTAWAMRLREASYASIHAATHLYKNHQVYSTFFSNTAYAGFPEWYLNHYKLVIADCLDRKPVCTPYVSVSDWLRVQEIGGGTNPRREYGQWPLSGEGIDITCGYCNSAVITMSFSRRRECTHCGARWPRGSVCPSCGADYSYRSTGPYRYGCANRHRCKENCPLSRFVGGKRLEEGILTMVLPHLTSEEMGEAIREANVALATEHTAANSERTRLERQLQAAQEEARNLAIAVAKSGGSTVLELLREREEEIGRLKAELAQIPEPSPAPFISEESAAAAMRLLQEAIPNLSRVERRQFFQDLGLKLKLYNDRAEGSIEWPPLRLFVSLDSPVRLGKRPRKESNPRPAA